ncbi:cytochrome ubiquinol oxidase subunit I [candidate division KSB1 bacterium]|nr:cytochrome ubiquinol oxidase subunit I [candidate division KSB1 bacterium]MBL7093864.1 cytochrome ubiquinol oxidase subunit I [candidate division KSB1 bacterium]
MDVVLLSRIQFAFTIGFHFLFPPITLGLTLIIFILEVLYRKKRDEMYKNMSSLFVKILGLVFVVGTATGIVMEFAFGNNWSQYSRFVGDIFGAPLAAEGIFAFFLESVFLGVLVFGRKKVSEKFYLLSAFLVFFGSHLSGLWIIIANSWMQTPAGFAIEGGRAVLTSFFDAALNHSTLIRFSHTIVSGWITGAFMTAGISAWYLLKKRHQELAKMTLKLSMILIVITSLLELGLGHAHSVQVAKTQPEKMAAFEALYDTQQGAPLTLFAIPDAKNQKNHLYIGIPKMLSFLIYFDFDAEVKGLNDFPEDERPPVFLPFVSYHVMIILGSLFIAIAFFGTYLLAKKKLWNTKWYLTALVWAIPLPHIAIQFGWIAAEVGRQPWVVYRVLRTADAASVVVPAWQILFTLIMFAIIYTLLFIVFMRILLKIIRKGPEEIATA